MDNYVVRVLSVAILILVVWQLSNRKGSPLHVDVGYLAAVVGTLTLVAVLVRGYVRYGEPHGSLYPLYLVLGTLFFASGLVAVLSGIALKSRRGSYGTMLFLHRAGAVVCAATLVSSLIAGLGSMLGHG